jgi:hypothetical protein
MTQGEAENWFFGIGAGLNFSSGTPEVIPESAINSIEACASISDSEGNLLFYSQANKIFNRDHGVMLNGDLHGYSNNATQGVGIVPMPNDLNKYYVFSLRYQAEERYAIDYAIIDMTGDGNRGEVIEKGINLREGLTEKLTFVQQRDSPNVWLLVHDFDSDLYSVFVITTLGIFETATYATGINHTRRYGFLQPSPDGSMLAASVQTGFISNGVVEVSRFDPVEGVISESFALEVPGMPYGVCFSPDNSKLYVGSGSPNHLYQFNLRLRDPDLIQASRIQITPFPFIDYSGSLGALQLAPNGKIYLALYETNFLSVINNPNASGLECDYVHNAVSLDGTGSCEGGLPNFGNLFWDQTPAYILEDPEPEPEEPPIEVEPEYDCDDLLVKGNPTSGAIILESFGDEISTVEVYDITGRSVIPETTYNSFDVQINARHLSSATYILRVKHGFCINDEKVVVAR